jgi:hypothetical protein
MPKREQRVEAGHARDYVGQLRLAIIPTLLRDRFAEFDAHGEKQIAAVI